MTVPLLLRGPLLPSPTRTNRRLAEPGTGRPLQQLAVADVDLDARTSLLRPQARTGPDAQGVHALVWFHGTPVGELTVLGPPEQVLPDLVDRAEQVVRPLLVLHLLEDALATPGGLAAARAHGLRSLPHPPRPAPGLRVSVAVCTRDRPEALRACLESIAGLDDPVHEVIVVDNASRGGATREVAESFPFVRCVSEPREGLDWARNRALLEATGDVLAYTDDDVRVHRSWVGALGRCFAEDPAAAAVTGLVVPLELATPAQVLFETLGGFGRGWRRRWYSAALHAGTRAGDRLGGAGVAGTGADMAFRREVLLALGGFDPALDVGTATGGGGDLEMFFRVVAAGHLLVYEPAAVAYHSHRDTRAGLVRQMRGNGTGLLSYLLGAGRNYPPQERRALRRVVRWWLVRWAGRRAAASLVAPDVLPPALLLAELRGAGEALRAGLYRRAQAQAREQSARHGATTLRPVHPPAAVRGARQADPVVVVDLHEDSRLWADRLAATAGSRRTRVRVLRAGSLQHVYTLHNDGAPVSVARLRASLVEVLGVALLEPGLSWHGWPGVVRAGPRLPHPPLAVGTGGRSAQEDGLLRDVLDGGLGERPAPAAEPGLVSVLVCTRDRPDQLRRSLAALADQSAGRAVQLVVVDNSPDPAQTLEVAAPFAAEVVHEPRPGLSRARNAATAVLRGDVVVLVDDDVVVGPAWLDRLLEPFADPRVGAVTGNVLPGDVTQLAPQVFEDYGGLGRGPHRTVYTPDWLTAWRGPAHTWEIGATANAAFRRQAAEQVGPWLESLGAGNPAGVGEDTEYFYRLLRAGWHIVYEPTAVVEHFHRPDLPSLAAQLRAYSAGHVAYHLELARRHGDRRGIRRVVATLPRQLLARSRAAARGDDYPRELLRAEWQGWLAGPSAWVRSVRSARS